MVDEKTKQQIMDIIRSKNFFTAKRVSKEINIDPRSVSRFFIGMEKEGLLKRWSKRQWTWAES